MSKFLDLVCYHHVNLEESSGAIGDLAVFASLLSTNLEKSEVSHLKYRILELKETSEISISQPLLTHRPFSQ